MKRNFIAVVISFSLIAGSVTQGQAPIANNDKDLLALIKEVQAQQAQIAENQGKIDAKLGEIAEILRVARIFTSRER
jgi:hypothetical protein